MSEYTWTDSDNNGTYDTGFADTDGNGSWDLAVNDVSGDGIVDAYQYDPNGNGVLGDEIRFDLNQDNVTDVVSYDYDENGIVDAFAAENTGWQVVAAPAPEPASFGPTVMPMQGAYWAGVQESFPGTFPGTPSYDDTADPDGDGKPNSVDSSDYDPYDSASKDKDRDGEPDAFDKNPTSYEPYDGAD